MTPVAEIEVMERPGLVALWQDLFGGPPPKSLSRPVLREWNGVTHVVDVTEQGYRWSEQTWRSLSVIAREITGAHWSGPRFFGLTGRAGG